MNTPLTPPSPRRGRPPGSKNKPKPKPLPPGVSIATPDEELENKTPLEYMLRVMNDPNAPEKRRDKMAIAAAAYSHRRNAELGKKKAAEETAKEISNGTGAFAPPEAPRLVVSNTKNSLLN